MDTISVQVRVNAPLHIVWSFWVDPDHIVNWNSASDDWHTTSAINDLWVGGHFTYQMNAKDGNDGFRFEGVYDKIVQNKEIDYTIMDGRKVKVCFRTVDHNTEITETIEPENENSHETQRRGWQAILNRFKYYVEINQK